MGTEREILEDIIGKILSAEPEKVCEITYKHRKQLAGDPFFIIRKLLWLQDKKKIEEKQIAVLFLTDIIGKNPRAQDLRFLEKILLWDETNHAIRGNLLRAIKTIGKASSIPIIEEYKEKEGTNFSDRDKEEAETIIKHLKSSLATAPSFL